MVRRVVFVIVIVIVILLTPIGDTPTPGPTLERGRVNAASATTAYQPVQPCRLADTRSGEGYETVDDQTLRVRLDACGLPDDAAAIVATTTIINPTTNGYLVTYPSGTSAPRAATLTWRAGITRGNAATITVGAGHSIDLFRSDGFASGGIAIDVVGAFVPATQATAGRFVPEPGGRRLLDTRDSTRLAGRDTINVPLPEGLPDDTTALAVTITAVDTSAPGFFTAYPSGTLRPLASVLNVDAPGQVRSAAAVVPVNPDGFDLYAASGADVVVDMTGWFTGASADPGTAGLFVPINPRRLADTRPEPRPLHPGGTIEIPLPDGLTDGIQHGAPAAAAITLTMVDPDTRGYVTAHASRAPRGEIASGTALHGEVAAQFTTTPTSAAGLAVYSSHGTELTVDLLGWSTGDSTPMTLSAPTNPIPVQRVLAIGDSTMAGVDRTGAIRALQGAWFDFRARSCRRLVRTSCAGTDGPIPPPTALDTLLSVPEDAYDVLIVMAGYNDTMPRFASDLPLIVETARAKGFRRIIWPTMAREFRYDKGGADSFQVYHDHNRVIRANAAVHDFMIAPDWASIVRQVPWWVYPDGIHLARAGGYGAADLMSRAVAHVTGQPCSQPEFPGGPIIGICPEPGSRPPVDVQTLYGF